MPLIFVIITSSPAFSMFLVIILIIIQISVSYYGITIKGQMGSMSEVFFYMAWFAPSAFYIAYTAKIFHNKRTQLKIAKKAAEKAHEALWGEMEIAKKIQKILLPKIPYIVGYEIAAYMDPAEEVGGDYYDIINTEKVDWIIIGDVSGHGVPAGLIMMMVQSSVRSLVAETPYIKPSELLRIVNRTIKYNIENMNENKFMTITAFAISRDGSILFSGRHEDIIHYNNNSNETKLINTDGIILSPWNLNKSEENLQLKLEAGDIVLLYTDGLIEAWDKNHPSNERIDNMFGVERLQRILEENKNESPDFIKEIIISQLKNFEIDDDVTFLVVKKII